MSWASLTSEFLREHSGQEFTTHDLAAFFLDNSACDYPEEIIRATANKHLRRQKKEGMAVQIGMRFGPDRRSYHMVWRAVR